MRFTKLTVGVFAAILFTFGVVSIPASQSSSVKCHAVVQPQSSHVMIADGGDPVPRPWFV
jgi:hypothetical protein